MKKEVFVNSQKYFVGLNEPVARFKGNPILTARDVNKVWISPQLKTIAVYNAGVEVFNKKVVMLFRAHLRSGISVIGLAESNNFTGPWKVYPKPVIFPEKDYELGGVEDPRIVKINNEYVITYSAYHHRKKDKVRIAMAVTKDFRFFKKFPPTINKDMRNTVIFPEKIKGKYYALFRFNDKSGKYSGGKFKEIKIGYSNDYKKGKWVIKKKPLIRAPEMPSSIGDKIGAGSPPIKTEKGWLNIFHGVRETMNGNPYVLSVALHNLENPEKVKVSNIPILFPTKTDSKLKDEEYVHVPRVVFTCGALERHGIIYLYYGGNDSVMNLGITHKDVLIDLCENYNQDPITGELLYNLVEK